jgi:hypothetical protein
MVQVQPQVFETFHLINDQAHVLLILYPEFYVSNARNIHDLGVVPLYVNHYHKS